MDRTVRFAHILRSAAPSWVAGLLMLLLGVGVQKTAQAQFMSGAADKVTWSVTTAPRPVAPGGTATVHLEGTIASDWKMYAMDSPPPSRGVSVRFDSLAPPLTVAGEPTQAEPKRGYDPNFKKDVTYFENRASLRIPLAVAEDAAEATHTAQGTVTFMVCNATMCLPPTPTSFIATVDVASGAPSASQPEAGSSTPDASRAAGPTSGESRASASESSEARAPGSESAAAGALGSSVGSAGAAGASTDGLWGFLLLAVGAGGAALLTPCVFPMIPLTVSYFTKHTDSRAESVRMAGLYGLSIIGTFTGLGVAMAALVGASGAQSIAANPWVNLFIGLTFIVFALSLLGLFELRLPSGLVNYFNRQGNERGGLVGVLFMGLTLTLVSFSCTAPFVGGLLGATAGGAWVFPVFGMLAFSATFALPFVGFAMFPKALNDLPQSGAWMNAVKVTLGFVELAAALKFLSNADLVWGTNLLSRPLAIAITVVVFALAGFYLLGKIRLKDEPVVQPIGSLRLLAATAFLGLALYMVPGLLGAPLGALDAYLPPRMASDVSLLVAGDRSGGGTDTEFDWHTDAIESAFAEGRSVDKPVFIDFTGYTCTNCRDMEANVFPQAPVAERFRSDYVLLRLYTDDLPDGVEFQRYQLRLTGTTALPTYAVVDPHDRTLLRTVSGVLSVERFASFLDAGAAQFEARQPVAAR